MDKTIIKVQCVSKKESQSFQTENPIATAIEFQVPYENNSIYYQLSGGSNFTLNTVNKIAADMFQLGDLYDVVISKSVE